MLQHNNIKMQKFCTMMNLIALVSVLFSIALAAPFQEYPNFPEVNYQSKIFGLILFFVFSEKKLKIYFTISFLRYSSRYF